MSSPGECEFFSTRPDNPRVAWFGFPPQGGARQLPFRNARLRLLLAPLPVVSLDPPAWG